MEKSAVLKGEQTISMIDILWRQDIDLGVEREVFDINFQERDEGVRRAREQEEEKSKRESELERILLTFGKLDKETGEVLHHCLSQNTQGPDDSSSFDLCIDTLFCEQTTPHSLVSLGNTHSTPSSQGSPVTQNPLLSALLSYKKPPAEEKKKASIDLPLPDLQHYLDFLETHVPESPCEPLVKTTGDCYLCQLPEPQRENAEMATVSGPGTLAHTHSGSAEIMQIHRYPDSATSEATLPLEKILPVATELELTFSDPEDLTQSFLDTIMSTSPPDDLNQMSLRACELSSSLPPQNELYPEHVNTTVPESLLCHREVIQKDSLHVEGDTLFSLESSRESTDLDVSLYGDDPFNTCRSEAEDTGCVQLDHTELFDLSLLSEAVDLEPSPPKTETSPRHLSQDHSHTETVSDQSEHSDEPVVHTSPSSKTETASPPQQGHRSWSVCRDEQRARTLCLPFGVNDIISMSVDAFNEAISTHELSDNQLSLMRDIRRRGKNKMAAQSCRKRKLDSLVDLEAEVEMLREESEQEVQERERNVRALGESREKLRKLYSEVFSQLRDEHGNPYGQEEYTLKFSTDGQVFLLPCTPLMSKHTSVHASVPH